MPAPGLQRGGPGQLSTWRRAEPTGVAPYNTLGYLFGAVARHPVTVA